MLHAHICKHNSQSHLYFLSLNSYVPRLNDVYIFIFSNWTGSPCFTRGCWTMTFFHHSSIPLPTAAPPLWTICQISSPHIFKATLNIVCSLLPGPFLGACILQSVQYSFCLFYLLSYFCLHKIRLKRIPCGFLCTRNVYAYFFLPILSHSALCQLSENCNTRKISQVSKSRCLRLLATYLYLYLLQCDYVRRQGRKT